MSNRGSNRFSTRPLFCGFGCSVRCLLGVSAGQLFYSLSTDDLRISFEAYTEVPQFTSKVCWWFEREIWE